MIALAEYAYQGVSLSVRDGARGVWDRGIVREVAAEYLWERIDWAQVRTMIDIGAHIGAWTRRAALRAPAAQCIAVEVNSENYVLLGLNTHNLLQRVYACHGAAWYGDEPLTLAVAAENSGGHCVVTDGRGLPVTERWTLEQLAADHAFSQIDVLKLDCEGSEHNLLAHISDDLLARTRWIVGEFHCTAEQFRDWHAARLTRTHTLDLIPHPNAQVLDLGMFFMEHRSWPHTDSNS